MSLPKTFVKGFHYEDEVKKMEYLPLGETGLFVSKVSIGGATLCSLYGELDEEEAVKTIVEAVKRGINYIDTAPFYGQGKSESVVGKALKLIPREAYYIATKVGRYDRFGKNQFDFSFNKTLESIEVSLKLLGLEYVDILQIHDIEFAPNMDIVLNQCLPAVEQLKKQGKTRNIGVTGYPLNVLKEAIAGAPNRFNTVLSYARATLIDNSLAEYMPFFQENKLGIVCASGHACGMLVNTGPQEWHAAYPEVKAVIYEAIEICKKNNVELGKLAMYHFLQFPGPATYLVGMQTIRLLDINLDAYYNGLTPNETAVLKQLNDTIFPKITKRHWEGVELERYWALMNKE